MTNGSVVDTTRDVAVIVGIIDAHRARHVVVARRVEGANMVMTDRCRDVTTTSTGTGTWTRRTSGTHTLCISLKYGYSTPIVMDFDGWTRVPIVSMSRDRRHTNTWTLCTHTTRRCTGQKDTRIVYTRPMSSIPKGSRETPACTPNDGRLSPRGKMYGIHAIFSPKNPVCREKQCGNIATGSHRVYALKTRATYGSRAHTRGRSRSLALYVCMYVSIYRRVMTRQSVIEGVPRPSFSRALGTGFFEKGEATEGGGRERTNGRTRRSIECVSGRSIDRSVRASRPSIVTPE